jgi:nucleoside-diphosphate-sugar epimerase
MGVGCWAETGSALVVSVTMVMSNRVERFLRHMLCVSMLLHVHQLHWPYMPALVTGASGFLGGRLAEVLVRRGEQLTVLARPAADLRHLHGLKVRVVAGDLSDIPSLTRAAEGVTHIYHCAACSSDWAPWSTFYDANVAGVRNLLSVSAKIPRLQRFVHVSTTDIYGYPRLVCDESYRAEDVGLPYNSSKCGGESLVREASVAGLPVTIIRPATIYGPRGKDFVVTFARHIHAGTMAVIDGGSARGGFAYVDNVVDAMLAAAGSEATLSRAYNIADGTGITWRQYVDAFADALGKRRPWIDLPFGVASRLARGFELLHSSLRLPGRPLLTRHGVLLLARDQEFPCDAARRDFCFSPVVSFAEGLGRSVAWLKNGGQ